MNGLSKELKHAKCDDLSAKRVYSNNDLYINTACFGIDFTTSTSPSMPYLHFKGFFEEPQNRSIHSMMTNMVQQVASDWHAKQFKRSSSISVL